MFRARRAGGNQARTVVCATPTVLNKHAWDRFDTDDPW
jgi:hypothetical protein